MMRLKFGLILLAVIPAVLISFFVHPTKSNGEIKVNVSNTSSNELGISFVGDINLASNVDAKLKQAGPHYPFEKVKPYLSVSDLSIGNLETSVALGGSPKDKEFTFRSNPLNLEGIKWSGIDILSNANNHILDYGSGALNETLNNLDQYSLLHAGAGRNLSEALKPAIIKKNNMNIAFFAASHVIPSGDWAATYSLPGVVSAYNPQLLLEKVNESSKVNDLTIVYMHWGKEREIVPDNIQKTLAHQLVDNGADIVVGTHSHTVQGFEFYKGKLIAYSLGNFVFTDYRKDSMILNVDIIDKNNIKAHIIPCEIRNFRPEPLTSSVDKEEFYKMLEDRSINVKIRKGQLIETAD